MTSENEAKESQSSTDTSAQETIAIGAASTGLVQLYRPAGSLESAQSLLENDDFNLTANDVLEFCRKGTLPQHNKDDEHSARSEPPVEGPSKEKKGAVLSQIQEAYHGRRREIRDLACKFWQGEAFVDGFGRLLPVPADETEDQQFPPPLAPLPAHNNDNNNVAHNNLPPNVPLNNLNNNLPFPLDADEEERQWVETEEREAAAAIARAIERYKQEGVPTEDYVLIRVPPMGRPERTSLTFRRICCCVLAVVTAFLCIMLQTLPLFPLDNEPDPIFDKLMYELMEVRPFEDHVMECRGLHRSPPTYPPPWLNPLSIFYKGSPSNLAIYFGASRHVDCSKGVLHVPSKSTLVNSYFESSTHRDHGALWEPYVLGVNASWFLPCNFPVMNDTTPCQQSPSIDADTESGEQFCNSHQPGPSQIDNETYQEARQPRCFRGIHDNMISDHEVGETLRLGSQLIHEGWDHFDIHRDKNLLLKERLPTLLHIIRSLLQETYGVPGEGNVNPVAFRVNAVGPFDGHGVALHGNENSQNSNYLLRILNKKKYAKWIEKHQRRNELGRYSLAWPTRRKPFRDPCFLMSDMEADPNFSILTTVFLSTGGGVDFRGGVALYVDDHPSNDNPRRKLKKGVTIDGSRGRLVVSTGGYENRRCRLPTRRGIRASLQIWWNCEDGTCVS